MKVFVHIGFHKTGTTTLQAVLKQNANLVGDRTMVLLHNSERLMPLQKACLSFARHPNDNAGEGIIRATHALLHDLDQSGIAKVLISSEMLSGPIPSFHRAGALGSAAVQIAPYLRRAFQRHDTSFCLYTRNQDRWLASLHAHLVRSRGIRLTQRAFLQRAEEQGFQIEALAEATSAALGGAHVFRMENEIANRLGPGTGFLKLANFDEGVLEEMQPVAPRNIGLRARFKSS